MIGLARFETRAILFELVLDFGDAFIRAAAAFRLPG